MSADTGKLLNLMLVIVGFFGFWFVWSDILPAFSVLHEVTLWYTSGVVAGEETQVPVSLADVAVAVLIAFLTIIAMKRLPPLLEILLLQRVNMTSGSRYTAKTLYTYAIVGIGMVAFFNVIGMDWSRVQWLFAALSVGIGFGLQEIVANFITGLIILFERPIRVGDIVTIGDKDGAVTASAFARRLLEPGTGRSAGPEQRVHHRTAAELDAFRPDDTPRYSRSASPMAATCKRPCR